MNGDMENTGIRKKLHDSLSESALPARECTGPDMGASHPFAMHEVRRSVVSDFAG